jgi:type I restriction enzyme, S subunit
MTPHDLLVACDTMAEAPDGMARLRWLVLQLAVRGRLVPQDPTDESGSALLASIPAEKARLESNGLVREVEHYPAQQASSLGFKLPPSWAVAPLGNLALVLDHLREPVKAEEREARCLGKPKESLYPYFGATQQQGWIDEYRLDGEFVLLGEDGVPFLDPMRKKAYLVSGRVWVNNHAHVLFGVRFSNYFLLHYLNQFNFSGRVTGTTRAKLTKGDLIDIPVPVPPLAEQHRIVARVDELMSLVDRLEAARTSRDATRAAARDSVLDALREADAAAEIEVTWRRCAERMEDLLAGPADIAPLRQTVLELAVRGRLVRQNPTDEPASAVLERIATEKARRTRARAGRLSTPSPLPPSEVEAPFKVPNGWEWCHFDDVLTDIEAGWSPSALDRPKEGAEWGVLKVSACSWGRFLPNENKSLAPGTKPRAYLEVHSDDLLISRANTSDLVGRSVLVGECPPNLMLSDKTLRLRLGVGAVASYLNIANLCASSRAHYERNASGTSASMRNISQDVIRSTLIPLPPTAEQHRIVVCVDELMDLLDRLEEGLTTARTTQAAFAAAAIHASTHDGRLPPGPPAEARVGGS